MAGKMRARSRAPSVFQCRMNGQARPGRDRNGTEPDASSGKSLEWRDRGVYVPSSSSSQRSQRSQRLCVAGFDKAASCERVCARQGGCGVLVG